MKILHVLFFLVLPVLLFGQTNIDRFVAELDSLSRLPLMQWKYSTEMAPANADAAELSRFGYDDSQWKDLALDESIYVDSCWLRKEVILPEYLAGEKVRGALEFLLSVDDFGYLWVNGESRGKFLWNGEFVLTENAKPGMKLVLLIKAVNTGGPLRIIRARTTSDEMDEAQQKIRDLVLSIQVGQKLLGFDTYQTNSRVRFDPEEDKSKMDRDEKIRLMRVLESSTKHIDLEAMTKGKMKRFWKSVDRFREAVQPVKDFAQRFTLYFDANAHIDAAWLWREKETIEVCNQTFGSVMNMMEARPNFTYTQSQAALYAWMEELNPELFKKIQQRVKECRWEVIGGMWVEPDCNLPSGVAWARQLLYGQRFFRKHFGKTVEIGWNPDSFGYNWNMPLFFQNAGIDAFITQKIGWNDTSVFPHRAFWWESPDGSRILAYFPFSYVDTIQDPFRLVDWLRQFEANTGFPRLLILFGVGNHGGGPSIEMMERIDRLRTLDIYPKIEYGTAERYLGWMKGEDLTDLPVWNDELYLEYHRGTYTTQASTKKWNRSLETLLTNVEKFSALAALTGRSYNHADIEEAWRTVLFNQFHDILPGSSIREVYHDSEKSYQKANEIGWYELKGALKSIVKTVDTKSVRDGKPVVVFNPLGWPRTDIVHLHLPKGDEGIYSIWSTGGKEIPSQIIQNGKYDRQVMFVAEDVPSLGFKTYVLGAKTPKKKSNSLKVAGTRIENEFFRVDVDTATGWLGSIWDKRAGREVLDSSGNALQIFDDRPDAWDAWNIGLNEQYPSKFRKIEIVENGPVRVVLRVHHDYLKPGVKKSHPTEDFPSSFFTQDIILTDGLDRIDFQTNVEWWETKTMLKVAFPVTVNNTVATYEIPFGTIERSTTLLDSLDKGKWEVPSLRWVDLSDDVYGVSLLNESKYGHDIKGNVIRLSLLRSPVWPDPTADRGDHAIRYALVPHAGDWKDNKSIQRGFEYNTPLLAVPTPIQEGTLPMSHSYVKLEPENLLLSSVKQDEHGEGAWIVQWVEIEGRNSEAVLTLPKKIESVQKTDFLEGEGESVDFDGNVIRMPTPGKGVVTLKVRFQ